MTIYEALPKITFDGHELVAYIDAPVEFTAESVEFRQLTEGFECPLLDDLYQNLLDKSPVGWKQAFELLREQGFI